MAFDLNTFVIDRVVRGTAFSHADGSVLYTINQIQNPSLNCASESADAVDALGTPIATFYRAKSAELSAENALFDMNLMATQLGTKKKIASAAEKIVVPAFETIDITGAATYTLKHTPLGEVKEIYALNGDSTLSTKFTVGTSASATEFMLSGTILTPPTGLANGTQLYVMYEYESDEAVEVVNSAKEFPAGCKFVMEVLGCDVCDQTTKIYAYIVFPNAKLSPDFDWSIQTDGTHPFTLRAQQDYCDKEKKLFSIVIPSVDDED